MAVPGSHRQKHTALLCRASLRNGSEQGWRGRSFSCWQLNAGFDGLAHVPAKWVRFADKDMRQHENLRRFPVILDHSVIQYDREAL
jgi:hypothetical protein